MVSADRRRSRHPSSKRIPFFGGILQHSLSRVGTLNRPCLTSWPGRIRQARSIRFRVLLQRGTNSGMHGGHALWSNWHSDPDARKLGLLPQNVDCSTQERLQVDCPSRKRRAKSSRLHPGRVKKKLPSRRGGVLCKLTSC